MANSARHTTNWQKLLYRARASSLQPPLPPKEEPQLDRPAEAFSQQSPLQIWRSTAEFAPPHTPPSIQGFAQDLAGVARPIPRRPPVSPPPATGSEENPNHPPAKKAVQQREGTRAIPPRWSRPALPPPLHGGEEAEGKRINAHLTEKKYFPYFIYTLYKKYSILYPFNYLSCY